MFQLTKLTTFVEFCIGVGIYIAIISTQCSIPSFDLPTGQLKWQFGPPAVKYEIKNERFINLSLYEKKNIQRNLLMIY